MGQYLPIFALAVLAIIFGISCWALHKRDQLSIRNRSQKAAPVPATVNA